MSTASRQVDLWSAFREFFWFAPGKISIAFILMLLQGVTAGIGLLLIVPLLQLIGISLGEPTDSTSMGFLTSYLEGFTGELSLLLILLIYVGIGTVIATSNYCLAVISVSTQQKYINFLRNRLYSALLGAHWQFLVQHKMSDFIHCLSGQVQSVGYAAQQMLQLLSSIVIALVYVALALALSWKMCLLAMVCGLGLLALILPLNRLVWNSGQRQLICFKSIFQMLTEQLASLKMIKSYASERHHAVQVAETSVQLEQQHIKMARISAMTQWVFMVGTVLAFSVLLYFSLHGLSISLASMLVLLVIFSRLMPRLMNIQSSYQRLLHQLPAINDINGMLACCRDAQEAAVSKDTPTPVLKDRILLKNVSYKYPGELMPVFENLTIEIGCNKTTALVGPSGAGKSTLADLIAGLLVPDQGHLFCDELEITLESRQAWRRKIAYVTQEVFLFHQSVRENLTWVKPGATDEDCWRVLELAAADGFIKAMPNGLDTVIGDRGIRLSGGERQRLAIARALMSKPQLLILDEATSALDSESEGRILQALMQLHGKLTIVIIAHRQTTLEHVDLVVQVGDSSDTMRRGGNVVF